MRPTTLELLETMDHVLETQIIPKLPDEHSKARMSVISQIVRTVHNRVRLEGLTLATDNADLATVLAELRGEGGGAAEAAYIPVEDLAERNNQLKEELAEIMRTLDDRDDPQRTTADATIRAYLRRELDRELELCSLPTFGSTSADLPLV
jgi:hypothetical protein